MTEVWEFGEFGKRNEDERIKVKVYGPDLGGTFSHGLVPFVGDVIRVSEEEDGTVQVETKNYDTGRESLSRFAQGRWSHWTFTRQPREEPACEYRTEEREVDQ